MHAVFLPGTEGLCPKAVAVRSDGPPGWVFPSFSRFEGGQLLTPCRVATTSLLGLSYLVVSRSLKGMSAASLAGGGRAGDRGRLGFFMSYGPTPGLADHERAASFAEEMPGGFEPLSLTACGLAVAEQQGPDGPSVTSVVLAVFSSPLAAEECCDAEELLLSGGEFPPVVLTRLWSPFSKEDFCALQRCADGLGLNAVGSGIVRFFGGWEAAWAALRARADAS